MKSAKVKNYVFILHFVLCILTFYIMSRIGKKTILIPDGVTLSIDGSEIKVKGPKGELMITISSLFKIDIKDKELNVIPRKQTRQTPALWGTTRALIANLINGVVAGYEKKLELEGVGYAASLDGKDLVFKLGLSHLVRVKCPESVQFNVEKNLITVSGIDKQLVGQIAAVIRSKKKPEPYKGKGIHYLGEVIKRKAGKKVAGSTA